MKKKQDLTTFAKSIIVLLLLFAKTYSHAHLVPYADHSNSLRPLNLKMKHAVGHNNLYTCIPSVIKLQMKN